MCVNKETLVLLFLHNKINISIYLSYIFVALTLLILYHVKEIFKEVGLETTNPVGYKGYIGHFELKLKGIGKNYNTIKLLEIEDRRFLNEL